ncbi:PE family protein [Mycobacterium sp. 852002-51163_SCH5372311]|uniref:PPE family protein, SVP subgroup n=1 Tax=Mycobacterium sp. 852002-51163_SCH5372311 TaxID=1834097 RepID=UPI000800BA49|nr:PE domain-containing protein [Mycobacterium sp. 852002-51163_SCH5372311]OBF92680.1 PE family protein [Mycobacterium sp. 852002-51163_SCH5372311]
MSFLTALPEELLAAQALLSGITSNLTAQNMGAAAPTTTILPAAADPVSAQQAAIFAAYGTQYQTIAAEAQTLQEQYVSTLGTSSTTYSATEAANAAQAATPSGNIIDVISGLLGGPSNSLNGQPFSLSSNLANYFNIGGGNWASAGSDLLGLGGLLNAPEADAAAAADLAGATAPAPAVAPAGGMGGMGAMPMAAVGQATMVGNRLSVPPSWAGTVTSATSSATALETVGWTAAAPQAGAGAIVPGMPGMVTGARNSAGFGAPRYGVKPIVMPKPTAV